MDLSNIPIVDLAATVATHLQQCGVEVVLVGGLAVEIYTENLYLTKDIDMVNTNYQKPRVLNQAMAELGFFKKGRVYTNNTTDITVEFPPGPLSVGDELIHETIIIRAGNRQIPILRLEDVVKDRLAAFIHWQDNQSLVQAVALMLKHQLVPKTFRVFCEREGALDQYELMAQFYHHAQDKQAATMQQLEAELTQMLLDNIKY